MDIQHLLHNFTLEQKIGQMFMLEAVETQSGEVNIELLKKFKIGNFFMGKVDRVKVKRNTKKLQEYSNDVFGIPALIAIDFEGGCVRRGLDMIPGASAVASSGSLELCEQLSELCAKDLLSNGINLNFAPVCDVCGDKKSTIGISRFYGDDSETVSKFSEYFIKGHQNGGCFSCAKHFPGHGFTSIDSHLNAPRINRTLEELEKIDILPFKNAIKAGVSTLMMGHLYTAIDENNLASQSAKTINYIREKLKFDGVIVTDSMNMHAITDNSFHAACKKSILAGVDLLLRNVAVNDCETIYGTIEKIADDVRNGEIPEELINKACERILKLKSQIKPCVYSDKYEKSICSLSKNISQRSVKVVKDDINAIPLKHKKICCITPSTKLFSFSDIFKEETSINIVDCSIPSTVDNNLLNHVLEKAKEADCVVFIPINLARNESQRIVLKKLLQSNDKVIVVPMINHTDVDLAMEAPTVINGCEFSELAAKSVINLLLGNK